MSSPWSLNSSRNGLTMTQGPLAPPGHSSPFSWRGPLLVLLHQWGLVCISEVAGLTTLASRCKNRSPSNSLAPIQSQCLAWCQHVHRGWDSGAAEQKELGQYSGEHTVMNSVYTGQLTGVDWLANIKVTDHQGLQTKRLPTGWGLETVRKSNGLSNKMAFF